MIIRTEFSSVRHNYDYFVNSQFIIMITSVGYDLPERTGKHVNS